MALEWAVIDFWTKKEGNVFFWRKDRIRINSIEKLLTIPILIRGKSKWCWFCFKQFLWNLMWPAYVQGLAIVSHRLETWLRGTALVLVWPLSQQHFSFCWKMRWVLFIGTNMLQWRVRTHRHQNGLECLKLLSFSLSTDPFLFLASPSKYMQAHVNRHSCSHI